MIERLLTFENLDQYVAICNYLNENNIPFADPNLNRSSLPHLNSLESVNQIMIEEKYSQLVFKQLDDDINTELILPDANASYKKYVIGLAVLSFVFGILLLKYYKINQRASYSPNFDSSWNMTNTKLSMNFKKDGQLHAKYYDQNIDYNFELISEFRDGLVVENYFDVDENGVIEKWESYNSQSEIIGGAMDSNQDGIWESTFYVLENGDTIKLVDSNNNGHFDLLEN